MKLTKSKNLKILTDSIIIVIIDQITKYTILRNFDFDRSINFISGLVNLRLVKNTGAAFSLFSNATPILKLISILASLILITIIFKSPSKTYWNSTGLAFLLGGTLGNGLDRIINGYVIDFIELVPVNFPIFNLADIAINIAVLCFLVDIIKSKNHSLLNNKN